MKKLIALLMAAAMIVCMFAGCGSTKAPAETQAPAATQAPAQAQAAPAETEAPAPEAVTLRIAYMPNWGALWAVSTAQAKGYFAEENITLELIPFEDGPTEIAAMESGNIDISYIGPGAHKLCSTGNAKVLLLQHLGDGDCIIGLNGITQLEELKGKKIGYAAGTSSETILLTALESVGLTIDDVDALSMDSTALTTAALSGSVDAVAASPPSSLPHQRHINLVNGRAGLDCFQHSISAENQLTVVFLCLLRHAFQSLQLSNAFCPVFPACWPSLFSPDTKRQNVIFVILYHKIRLEKSIFGYLFTAKAKKSQTAIPPRQPRQPESYPMCGRTGLFSAAPMQCSPFVIHNLPPFV